MNNNYAIIENDKIVNIAVVEDANFANSQGWILLPERFGIDDFYVNGNFEKKQDMPISNMINFALDLPTRNKLQAQERLKETDWTATIDVSNPQYSNPYLTNQQEFLDYRNILRQIAINPPDAEVQWPKRPTEVWSQ